METGWLSQPSLPLWSNPVQIRYDHHTAQVNPDGLCGRAAVTNSLLEKIPTPPTTTTTPPKRMFFKPRVSPADQKVVSQPKRK